MEGALYILILQQLKGVYESADYEGTLSQANIYLNIFKEKKRDNTDDDLMRSFQSAILNFASNSCLKTGRLDEAMEHANFCVELCLTDKRPLALAKAYNNRGLVFHEKELLKKAEDDYIKGIGLLEKNSDEESVEMKNILLSNLNILKILRGENSEFKDNLLSNEAVASSLPHLIEKDINKLNNIGHELLKQGKLEDAENYFISALKAIKGREFDVELIGIIHCNLGQLYVALNKIEMAFVHYNEAIKNHSTKDILKQRLATDLFNLGCLYQELGKRDEALSYFKKAWDTIRQQAPHTLTALLILKHLGLQRMLLKDYDRSRAAFKRGMELYEEIRPVIALNENEHASYFQAYRGLAEMAMYVALNESWIDELLVLIERAKARYWKEKLEAKSTIRNESKFIDSADRIRSLTGYNSMILNFFVGPNATFISYCYNNSLGGYRIDITESELKKVVASFRIDLMSFSRKAGEGDAGKKLGKLLFEKIGFPEGKIRHLHILPDGPLWDLPFEALPVNFGANNTIKKIFELAPVSYFPSVSVLDDFQNIKQTTENKAEEMLLIGISQHKEGFQQLIGVEKEISLIVNTLKAHHIPLIQFKNKNATKENFFRHISNAKYIHISTHAVSDKDNNTPFILFHGNKIETSHLWMHEIEKASFSAELVFLSACSTAIGVSSLGEGLMSLSRAFLWAGCKSVIATQWHVNDEKTSDFTFLFYESLLSGNTIAKALQIAKKNYIAKSGETRIWSSFQVYGECDTHEDRYSLGNLNF